MDKIFIVWWCLGKFRTFCEYMNLLHSGNQTLTLGLSGTDTRIRLIYRFADIF